jgi:DNA-binding transcriptional LysR family regulator
MQPNPTLDQLQILVTVADTGSFSAAGRKLNRAQSVISYAIANLEAQLGLKLFEREGTREPQLTDVGRATLGMRVAWLACCSASARVSTATNRA